MTDWKSLPEPLQLHLAEMAMRQASETLARHAEILASEIESGTLSDQGGPDGLRLFAAVVRAIHGAEETFVGTA